MKDKDDDSVMQVGKYPSIDQLIDWVQNNGVWLSAVSIIILTLGVCIGLVALATGAFTTLPHPTPF